MTATAASAAAGARRGVKRSRYCTRTVAFVTLTHHDNADKNTSAFSGRVHGRGLSAGLYTLRLTPLNPIGVAGSSLTTHLRILVAR